MGSTEATQSKNLITNMWLDYYSLLDCFVENNMGVLSPSFILNILDKPE